MMIADDDDESSSFSWPFSAFSLGLGYQDCKAETPSLLKGRFTCVVEATEQPQKKLKDNQRWVKRLPTLIAFNFLWIAALSSMETMLIQKGNTVSHATMMKQTRNCEKNEFLFISPPHLARLKHHPFRIEGRIWQLVQERVYYDSSALPTQTCWSLIICRCHCLKHD